MSVTKLTRETVIKIHKELDDAVKAVLKNYGLTYQPSRLTYTENDIRMKVVGQAISTDPAVLMAAETKKWDSFCTLFGLKSTDYGRKFQFNGKTFELTGFNLKRNTKYPVLAVETRTQKTYKFAAETVRAFLK